MQFKKLFYDYWLKLTPPQSNKIMYTTSCVKKQEHRQYLQTLKNLH